MCRPVFKLVIHVVDSDPWERFEHDVPPNLFGSGATRDFRAYFEGESTVTVRSVDDICDWLLDCTYAPDQDEFGVADHWQHPEEFEARRRGDCDDHALWAWRKLTELGVRAELVCGQSTGADDRMGGHAWVQFQRDGVDYLLESVSESREAMIRPLTDVTVRVEYSPHFAVTADFRRHAYWGYVRYLRDRF